MVLSLNSIEHQVKQYGDTTYKFEYGDKFTNKKTYYRRIVRDPLKEEKGGDWYKFMTKPNKEVYKTLCDLYTEQEPGRFKGTIKKSKPAKIIKRKSAKPRKSTDGFSEGTEVLYEREEWVIETTGKNDIITIERKGETKEVNKSDLTIVRTKTKDSDSDYSPSEEDNGREEKVNEVDEILVDDTISNANKYAILEALGVFKNTTVKKAIPPEIKKIGNTINRGTPVDIAGYTIVDVPGDGNCMYHAVLRASQCLKKEPGISMGDDPQKLRNFLVSVLKGEEAITTQQELCLSDFFDFSIANELQRRIERGAWGGDNELALISCLYNYPITVLRKVNRNYVVSNAVDMKENGLTVVWVDRSHYKYLKPIAGCLSPSLSTEEYLSDASIQSEY
jgi:hypothetical protein